MKIETKYDIGQEVWLMWENKAIQRKIDYVSVDVYKNDQYESYEVEGLEGDDKELNDVTFELDELFPTKEELLESL